MAKFRRNHHKESQSKFTFFRIIGFLILVLVVMYFLIQSMDSMDDLEWSVPGSPTIVNVKPDTLTKTLLPTSTSGQVVDHQYFTLSYREDHEQAEWVAYLLTEESLRIPNVPRSGYFNPDYSITTRSAYHRDYTHSGFTRGHLAPAGDMAFSEDAMETSFYMSNISPQLRAFNNGIWKELEETVRDWAFHYDEVYVVTGPILKNDMILDRIGKNRVSVPQYFYKIILHFNHTEPTAIAFLIENKLHNERLEHFVVSIDSIEALTGINFFADVFPPDVETRFERSAAYEGWKFSEKRYQLRINEWNQQ